MKRNIQNSDDLFSFLGIKSAIYLLVLLLSSPLYSQTLEFAKSTGGAYDDWGKSIIVDEQGYIFTTGFFTDTTSIGATSHEGKPQLTVSKADNLGNQIWIRRIPANVNSTQKPDIKLDKTGHIYIAFTFNDTVYYKVGSNTYYLASNGSSDICIMKLDTGGSVLWTKNIGGAREDFDPAICLVKDGSIMITGSFAGESDFDPDSGIYYLSSVHVDAFILKLNIDGNFIWAKRIGGLGTENVGVSVVTDSLSNIYLAGNCSSAVLDLDPNSGTYYRNEVATLDFFIVKLNTNGEFVWGKRIGGSGSDKCSFLGIDNEKCFYLAGEFSGEVDFNPEGIRNQLISEGSFDGFLYKFDSDGNFLWSKNIGGTGSDYIRSFATDKFGYIYAMGEFWGIADFDPSTDIFYLTALSYDIFIVKLDSAGNLITAFKIGGDGTERSGGIAIDDFNSIYAIGSYEKTVNFNLQGSSYLSSVTARSDVFSVKYSQCNTSSLLHPLVCKSYISPSGKYTFSQNGIYRDTLLNSIGCDSLIIINLTLLNIDTTVTLSGSTLFATPNVSSYQWLNCSNFFSPIPGANSQQYTPTSNGIYAVAVTKNGCTDTSGCYPISTVGVAESILSNISIHPNPTNGEFLINAENIFTTAEISISNTLGQLVYKSTLTNTSLVKLFIEGANGLYFLQIKTPKKVLTAKILKQ